MAAKPRFFEVVKDPAPLYVPFQEPIIPDLEDRLEWKRMKAIQWLGDKWILHPKNGVKRKG